MRRIIAIAFVVSSAVAWSAVAPPDRVAACASAAAPFDSFTAAVPNAGTIVIGTAEPLSKRAPTARFRLRIDEVIRGTAPAAMRFGGLRGGTQRSACGDRSTVVVRSGDRLVLAMTPATSGRPFRVDAVGFIGDRKPHMRNMPGVEFLKAAEVRRLAGAATDGSESRRPGAISRSADNLVTTRVDDGVRRLSSVGTAHVLRAIRDIEIDPADGRVWATTRNGVFALASRAEFDISDGISQPVTSVAMGPGGRVAVGSAGTLALFERYQHPRTISRRGEVAELQAPIVTSNGVVVARSSLGVSRFSDEWIDDTWAAVGAPRACLDEAGALVEARCRVSGPVVADDGSVWVGLWPTSGDGSEPGMLRKLVTGTWSAGPELPELGGYALSQLASYPGSGVWALLEPSLHADARTLSNHSLRLAHWDGTSWSLHRALDKSLGSRDPGQLAAGPDGVAWLSGPLVSFDGSVWRRFEMPDKGAARKPEIRDLAVAPDGTVWTVIRDRARHGDRGRGGIYLLDPDRAALRSSTPDGTFELPHEVWAPT